MKKKLFKVQVRVYVDEMMAYFKDNPDLGSKEKPYDANSFYELISPYAAFYGPLRNILLLDSQSVYQWELVSANGKKLSFTVEDDAQVMDLEMISNAPTEEKWKKIFKNPPPMQGDGKLKVHSKNTKDNVFELETSDDVSNGGRFKYTFYFEFNDAKGVKKYGVIDPMTDTNPPPPPPDTSGGN